MRSLLICIAFVLASLNVAKVAEPAQQLPLVKAGYHRRCVKVDPGALEKSIGIPLYPNRKDVA